MVKVKRIHVNKNVIMHNSKYGNDLPPCRVQQGSKSKYCREVVINGPSTMVYRPEDPLSCGAKLWIETNADVELVDEIPYSVLKEKMKDVKESCYIKKAKSK